VLYGGDAGAHAVELAYHSAEAQTVLGTEKLVRYSLVAGQRSLATYAWEDALVHFQRGLEARGVPSSGDEPAKDSEAAGLIFGVARAQIATLTVYQLEEATTTLTRAFDYYAEAGDVEQAVAVAECPIPAAAGYCTGMPQLIARALELVPPTSLPAARLLSLYGRLMLLEEGDYQAAQEAVGKALDIARQEGDAALELRALVDASEVAIYHANYDDAAELGERAIALTAETDDPLFQALAHYHASISLFVLGESDKVSRYAAAGGAAAERLRHPFYLDRLLFISATLARAYGNWQAAREFSDRGFVGSP
jgi:tetratricopeptide (TPR) repeat protein